MIGAVEQAAIATGSAFIGAIVGGSFALLAGRQQWRNSLKSRSHEAAARVLTALLTLSRAWVSLEESGDMEALVAAANGFIAAATAELPFVRDGEVSKQVRAHIDFTFLLVSSARKLRTLPKELIDSLSKHQSIVISTLEAHIKGDQPPDSDPLPMGSVADLIEWGRKP
jgi:hypothetical protein